MSVRPDIASVLAGEARWCVVTGDCLDILPTLPDGAVDAVVTDPPYDEKTHAGADSRCWTIGIDFAPVDDPAGLAKKLIRVSSGWVVVFCTLEMMGAYRDGAGDAWVRAGVWDKINPMPQFSGDRPAQAVEGVGVMHRPGAKQWAAGGKAGIWRHSVDRGKVHPTEKPICLMREILGDFIANENSVILDPFAGSGTTGWRRCKRGAGSSGSRLMSTMPTSHANESRRKRPNSKCLTG